MNNYIILNSLSSGNFGDVFVGQNKFTEEKVAIKREKKENGSIRYETTIYNYLSGISNIPKLKTYFSDTLHNYLVIELLDYDLKHYKKSILSNLSPTNQTNSKNSKNSKISILIIKLITILRDIHKKGIAHRDIKPENICFKANEPYILDFGLAKRVSKKATSTNVHSKLIGTPNYISLHVAKGNEPSYIDDLESLVYIILYLLLDDEELSKYFNNNLIEKKSRTLILSLLDDKFKKVLNDYLNYTRINNVKINYDYLCGLVNNIV